MLRSHAPSRLPPANYGNQVANVAHGWLLKEEFAAGEGGKAAEKSQLKHYWSVLFSNRSP